MGELFAYPHLGDQEMQRIELSASEAARFELRRGDLLFARRSLVAEGAGKCSLVVDVPEPTTFESSIIRVRPNPKLADSRYLYYFFSSAAGAAALDSIRRELAVAGITGTDLARLPLLLPHPSEQTRIANLLSTLDSKIELNRKANAALDAIALAVFKSWFVDFDPVVAKRDGNTPVGLTAETISLFPKHFEESEIGPIPQGWRVIRVDQAFEVNPRRVLVDGEVAPYVEMAVVSTTGHTPEGWTRRAAGSGMRFINGDTLMARITPCLENGKTAFVDFLEAGEVGWGSTEFVVLRSKPPMPLPGSYLLARNEDFRAFAIQGMTGSSGRQRVGADILASYKIALPSEPRLLSAFGAVVEPLFQMAHANSVESRVLIELRNTVLDPLLSGELTIKVAEAASGAAL